MIDVPSMCFLFCPAIIHFNLNTKVDIFCWAVVRLSNMRENKSGVHLYFSCTDGQEWGEMQNG